MAPRVAIVHDDLTQRGGAERVVLSLLRMFPDADVYAGVYDPDGTFDEFRSHHVRTTALQRLPHTGNAARALLPLYPRAFRRLVLRDYDLVVSSSSRFAHHVTVEGGTHVVYCYSPARFLYRMDEYFTQGAPVPPSCRRVLAPILRSLARRDVAAAARPDHYFAVSHEVAGRIRAVYGRDAVTVHPPVDTDRIVGRSHRQRPGAVPAEPYLLVVSRLLPYKRVDVAVEAGVRCGYRVVVVGSGPARRRLESLDLPRVELRGHVDDGELAALLHGCTALVQAGTEDFGLMPLEANAAGRPVVALAAGGAIETVIDGVSGVLVAEPTVDAFSAGIRRVAAATWREDLIRRHVAWFGEARFHAQLAAALHGIGVAVPRTGVGASYEPDGVDDDAVPADRAGTAAVAIG